MSSRLRARWRALTAVLGLDLLHSKEDLRAQAAHAAAASAAGYDKHVAEHRDSDGSPASEVAR